MGPVDSPSVVFQSTINLVQDIFVYTYKYLSKRVLYAPSDVR